MKTYRVTLIAYDPKDNFSYTVEADSEWDAFLKQPSEVPVQPWKTWAVEICESV